MSEITQVDFTSTALDFYRSKHRRTAHLLYLNMGNAIIKLHLPNKLYLQAALPALSHVRVKDQVKVVDVEVMMVILDASENMHTLLDDLLNKAASQESPDENPILVNNLKIHALENQGYCYDLQHNTLLWLIKPRVLIAHDIACTPFVSMFSTLFAYRNTQLTHSAVIFKNNRGIALCGESGVGKSTTTLACIENQFDYVAEDYCLIQLNNNKVMAYSIYNTMRFCKNSSSSLPYTNKDYDFSCLWTQKNALYAAHNNHITMRNKTELHTIIQLKREKAAQPCLKEISPEKACAALSLSTIYQRKVVSPKNLKMLLDCYNRASCHELILSTDMKLNLNLLNELCQV